MNIKAKLAYSKIISLNPLLLIDYSSYIIMVIMYLVRLVL